MSTDLDQIWTELVRSEEPYAIDAYQFVQEGLRETAERVYSDLDSSLHQTGQHVSGQQLCLGLKEYAIEQFGLLAKTVLNSWNIHRTDDFGRIVFKLVEVGMLTKTDEDSLDDFMAVFEFDEVFGQQLDEAPSPEPQT